MMEIGNHYARSSTFQGRMWKQAVRLLRQADVDTSRVVSLLDLGCGTGARTVEALSLFPRLKRVLAVDADPSMIRVARETNSDPRIEYRQHDIRSLGALATAPFDAVTAHWVLHWLEAKDTLLQDLDALTRTDAILLIASCERLPPILAKFDGLLRAELKPDTPIPYFCLDRRQWQDLLVRHAWEPIAMESYSELRAAPSDGSYLRDWYAASTGRAFYGATLEDLGTRFIDAARRELSKSFASPDGKSWLFHEDVVFILAQRG